MHLSAANAYGCESAHGGRVRCAFTLIELLVVITIIAILASMLLPAIGLVRAAAVKSKCSSQMRQLAAAILAYPSEHDGLLSPAWVGSEAAPVEWGFAPSGSPAVYWTDVLLGQYLDGFDQHLNEALPPEKYTSVVKCPATKRTDDRDWEGTMSMNLAYCPMNGGSSWSDTPLSRVPKQSETVVIIDGGRPFWGVMSWAGYPKAMNGGWWPWHGGNGANLLYFDGHTRFTTNVPAEFMSGGSLAE